MTKFSKKGGSGFSRDCLKHADLDQLTVDSEGVSRGRSVALAVGCWMFALQLHFNGTFMALSQHFHGTFTAKKKNKKVLVLLSALVERVSVSCMPEFFKILTNEQKTNLWVNTTLNPLVIQFEHSSALKCQSLLFVVHLHM